MLPSLRPRLACNDCRHLEEIRRHHRTWLKGRSGVLTAALFQHYQGFDIEVKHVPATFEVKASVRPGRDRLHCRRPWAGRWGTDTRASSAALPSCESTAPTGNALRCAHGRSQVTHLPLPASSTASDSGCCARHCSVRLWLLSWWRLKQRAYRGRHAYIKSPHHT